MRSRIRSASLRSAAKNNECWLVLKVQPVWCLMTSQRTTLFQVMLALLANPGAFGQPAAAPRFFTSVVANPAAPTITILPAATGALLRNPGFSNASLDLGRVSYFRGTSAPGESSQRHSRSFVTSTRFVLRVDCPATSAVSKVNVTMSRMDSADTHLMRIDGTPVRSAEQVLVQSMPCGSQGEHRLDVEVPVSTPAGPISSNVAFLATLNR